jgi:uncharacterized membrane protein
VRGGTFGSGAPLWNLLHQAGAFRAAGTLVIVAYPLIPWIAVMAAGFCFGRVFLLDADRRRRILLRTGASATAAFLILRAINVYGDRAPWTAQASPVYTVLSFLNCTKYPPSLLFLLMTLGPALMALAWLDRVRFTPTHPLIVFGRVPLFYFIVHFYAAHAVAALLSFVRYGGAASRFVLNPVPSMGGASPPYPTDFGWSLGVVYAVWAAMVIALYPLCRWFAKVKAGRRYWWLSYL